MNLKRDIESLLFVAAKPLTLKKIAELTGGQPEAVAAAVGELRLEYNRDEKGVQIQQHGQQVQMVSSPLAAKVVAAFVKDEESGELTDPAIETLTIIAYRGPMTKSELDQIRGVNCSLILRHLMMKGLVEASEDRAKMMTRYSVTLDFLRFLGVRSVDELPDYRPLRNDENLRQLLAVEPTAATPVEPPVAGETARVE